MKYEKVKHFLLSDIIAGHYKGELGSTFSPLTAESLNLHMKVPNARSYDSKCDKIAVKVNHPEKVKSTKNQEILNFGKKCCDRFNHNKTYVIKINQLESKQISSTFLVSRHLM